jgi:hypothetical protein
MPALQGRQDACATRQPGWLRYKAGRMPALQRIWKRAREKNNRGAAAGAPWLNSRCDCAYSTSKLCSVTGQSVWSQASSM